MPPITEAMLTGISSDIRYRANSLAPLMIGDTLQAIAFGILIVQYWGVIRASTVSRSLHVFLAILFLLNAVSTAVSAAIVWEDSVVYLNALADGAAYSLSMFIIGCPAVQALYVTLFNVIQCMTIFFFARRCYTATGRSRRIAIILTLMVFASFSLACITSAKMISAATEGLGYSSVRGILCAAIAVYAGSNVLASIILIHGISRAELIYYKGVITRICVFVLTTASLTAALSVIHACLLMRWTSSATSFSGSGKGHGSLVLGLLHPHIATICVLASVLSRTSLNEQVERAALAAAASGLTLNEDDRGMVSQLPLLNAEYGSAFNVPSSLASSNSTNFVVVTNSAVPANHASLSNVALVRASEKENDDRHEHDNNPDSQDIVDTPDRGNTVTHDDRQAIFHNHRRASEIFTGGIMFSLAHPIRYLSSSPSSSSRRASRNRAAAQDHSRCESPKGSVYPSPTHDFGYPYPSYPSYCTYEMRISENNSSDINNNNSESLDMRKTKSTGSSDAIV